MNGFFVCCRGKLLKVGVKYLFVIVVAMVACCQFAEAAVTADAGHAEEPAEEPVLDVGEGINALHSLTALFGSNGAMGALNGDRGALERLGISQADASTRNGRANEVSEWLSNQISGMISNAEEAGAVDLSDGGDLAADGLSWHYELERRLETGESHGITRASLDELMRGM